MSDVRFCRDCRWMERGHIRPWEAEAKILWETTKISAREIALKFRVSKNTLLGVARRREWRERGGTRSEPPPRTLHDRLDVIWAKFERQMAEAKALQAESRRQWKIRDDRHQRDQAAD